MRRRIRSPCLYIADENLCNQLESCEWKNNFCVSKMKTARPFSANLLYLYENNPEILIHDLMNAKDYDEIAIFLTQIPIEEVEDIMYYVPIDLQNNIFISLLMMNEDELIERFLNAGTFDLHPKTLLSIAIKRANFRIIETIINTFPLDSISDKLDSIIFMAIEKNNLAFLMFVINSVKENMTYENIEQYLKYREIYENLLTEAFDDASRIGNAFILGELIAYVKQDAFLRPEVDEQSGYVKDTDFQHHDMGFIKYIKERNKRYFSKALITAALYCQEHIIYMLMRQGISRKIVKFAAKNTPCKEIQTLLRKFR